MTDTPDDIPTPPGTPGGDPPPPPNAPSSGLPPVIPPETVGTGVYPWGICRSDDAGVIQTFQFEVRQFTHAETGAVHTHAETWGADPFDAAAAPIRFYPVRVTNSKPDPRWFENIACAYGLDERTPEVTVTWEGDLREFTEEIQLETKARIWDDADRRHYPYDYAWPREQEFTKTRISTGANAEIVAYREAVNAAFAEAMEDIDAAADMAALGRAESDYDATVSALTEPVRNPFR